MKASRSFALRSKWTKTKVLLQNSSIKPFIPDTQRLTRDSLETMINQYEMVYVKPEAGTFGNGVMRVEKTSDGQYWYQLGESKREFDSFDSFCTSLMKTVGNRSYLVQKGIHLLKHNKRRFDIRVMVQLSPKGKWEATAIIGRLAHPRKIVTNYHSGGTPMAVERLLSTHLSESKQAELIRGLYSLGVSVAEQLYKSNPKLKQVGVDIGLDKASNPWIIEVNYKPDPFVFNLLKDKSMYRKVMEYRRASLKKG